MSDKPKVYVAAVGMITPVGANAEMTAAAVKAGITRYSETDYFDKDYNRVKMALVPESLVENSLDASLLKGDFTARRARLLQLASLALKNLAASTDDLDNLPLFLAGPYAISEQEKVLDGLFFENLGLQSDIKFDANSSRIISTGRAGSLQAIKLAFRFLENSGLNHVIVGGVDSAYDQCCVDYYDTTNRLLCGENDDGFVPGEGACFLLLSRKKPSKSQLNTYFFEPGTYMEQGHMYSDEIYSGSGLSVAFEIAFSCGEDSKVEKVYSTMNGESFFAKELGVAVTRNSKHFINELQHEHPADCLGDLGAASGLVYSGIIDELFKKNNTSVNTLLYCSSDHADRAAVIMGNK
jgi:3-oxoacyl-[acyl-carrier-protein] synthase-1